jgi:hypothetical protein
MNSPPKEEGRIGDAARLETACTTTLIKQLREINDSVQRVWTTEGWRLLLQYQQTGSEKHLRAFEAHILGIRQRMRGVISP